MKQTRVRVTHIIPTLDFGGAERFVVDLINQSDSERFHYSIILLADSRSLAAEITRPDVVITVAPKRGKISPRLFSDLERILRQSRPDLVHTHLSGGDIWGRVAACLLNIPVVTTEHNTGENLGWLKSGLKRLLKSKTDFYVACSEAVKRDMIERYGLTQKIDVIRYGIDLSRFDKISPVTIHEPARLLLLGRLAEQKGHRHAISAVSGLYSAEWTLSIVGEGPLCSELQNQVGARRLKKNIRFFSPTPEIPKVLAEHDILLMPSLWEGLGIVVMEAMAAGRVVIASRVGGLPEIIEHARTGYLVPPADESALRRQIAYCLSHREKALRVGAAARQYARQHFNVSEMVAAYETIYEHLANP